MDDHKLHLSHLLPSPEMSATIEDDEVLQEAVADACDVSREVSNKARTMSREIDVLSLIPVATSRDDDSLVESLENLMSTNRSRRALKAGG